MPAKKKTEYMKLIEEEKKENEKKRLAIEQEKEKQRLKEQLITEYENKVKITGEAKLDPDKEVKKCTSVVLRPPKTDSTSRKAVNGVYCLGKKMENN